MSQLCSASKCERTFRAICDCCKQKLCIQHFSEHNALLISQLNPITDEINTLCDRLQRFHNHETIRDCRKKLERWRKSCHEKINRFVEIKHQELNQLISELVDGRKERILHIQSKMTKLVREQEATRDDIASCTSLIRQLEQEMDKIEQTCFRINTHSLMVDDSLIQIEKTHKHELNLSTLFPVHRALDRPCASYIAFASNDRLLLIHQKPNLCLVDQEMNIVKQVLWPHDTIWDMCWSSALNRFIVIEDNNILLVDERIMSIETVPMSDKRKWASCACSDTFLFLSARVQGSSLVKLSLPPSMTVIKEWKSSSDAHAKYERIDGIAYSNGELALMIRNKFDKSIRIELLSCESLDRIWLLPLDIVCNQDRRFNCCSLNCDDWLVADYETERLLHIAKDGKIKKIAPYTEIPYCVTLFNTNILAVSRSGGTNFYKL